MDTNTQAALDKANEASQLAKKGQVDAAIRCFETAIEMHPGMAGALCNLGALLDQSGRSQEAITRLQHCLKLQPEFPEAWNNYGNALLHSCQVDAAFQACSKATQLRPNYWEAHSNRMLSTLYRMGTAKALKIAHQEWRAALQAAPMDVTAFTPKKREKGQKIRLGFVSPDFRLHSVAFFLQPLLESLCKDQFELYLYSDNQSDDALTLRFKQLASSWKDCQSLSHQELTQAIRADSIDILFDLCGHFSHNRLPVFAARAASTQVAWLGFPGPTATPNIDYYIGDAAVYQEGIDSIGDAKLLKLPNGFHCYRPPAEAPAIASPPKESPYNFTFGCFNNAFKISPQIAELWGKILAATPNARLVLKSRGFADLKVRQQVQQWICTDKIDPTRVVFHQRTASLVDHLKAYGQIDLALDTYPYNGTTTTCEALWMGVPTISLAGTEPQSRVGASLLKQAKLEHFIASTPDAYLGIAKTLSERADYLTHLRTSLRTHLQQSDLLQPQSLSQPLAAALTKWVEGS